MPFNPDSTKQANELVLFKKKRTTCWLMNIFVVSTWLQHSALVPNQHGVDFLF